MKANFTIESAYTDEIEFLVESDSPAVDITSMGNTIRIHEADIDEVIEALKAAQRFIKNS